MKLIQMTCENCGASLEVNQELDKITCSYCGAEILIEDEASKLKRIEEAKLIARKANHEQQLKERNDLLQQELKEKQIQEEAKALEKFKKGKFSKVLLVFFAIAIISFFARKEIFEKILIAIQAAAFLISWLMGMKIIKEPKKGAKILIAILGFVLIVPILGIGKIKPEKDLSENIVWNDIYMKEVIPQPSGDKGQIFTNSNEYLNIYLIKQSQSDYNDYVNDCEEYGFKIDVEKNNRTFDGYNEDGYQIRIYYSEYSEELHIDLKAPMVMKENAWSDSDLVKILPKPKSTKGKIEYDTSTNYVYYAADTSIDDFEDYVKAVKAKNFDIDYEKGDKYYSAEHKDGFKVTLEYQGYKIMKISLTKITESKNEEMIEEKDEDIETDSKEESNQELVDGMRKEFKEAMDAYEAFYDEYIGILEAYKNNSSDLTILLKYGEMIDKEADMLEKFEKWDEEELNDIEKMYYLEVYNRVSQKLLNIE